MTGAPYRTPWTPPSTRVERRTDRYFGVEVPDPYRWLEGTGERGQASPDVAAWTDAQNAHTRRVLDALPGRAAIEGRLRALLEVGSVGLPSVRRGRYFHARREGRQDQPVVYWRQGHDGTDHVLLDPHVIDPTGLTAVEWIAPSPTGRQVAFGTYRAGDENTTLRLVDVDTGRLLPLEIPSKTQAPDWLPDESGFVYQNLEHPGDPYSGRVRFHRLGTSPARDVVLFRHLTADENRVLATTWGPFGTLSRDGRWLVLGYWVDTRSNDLWVVDFHAFLRTGRVDRIPVVAGEPGRTTGTVVDGTLYLHTTVGAPRGRVVAVDPRQPDRASWRDVVPEREDVVIEAMALGRGVVAVTGMHHASSRVDVFDLEGRPRGRLPQPGLGSVSLAAEPETTEGFLQYASFNMPPTIFRVDLRDPAAPSAVWARPDAPLDPATVQVTDVWYPSKDGTPISMFLVHRSDLEPTGTTPTVLTGYGGFNISMTPAFSAPAFHWVESGGLYAVPHIRGGGEYGDAWHLAGTLDRKQTVFDDFIAAAEWLVGGGYTCPDRLAVAGGSNGGLLVGAAITQRPDLYRAAVIAVPLLDMLRYQEFLMARYWVPEYGSSEDRRQFEYLVRYSPYHRVEPGTAYPAVLITTGEHDTRVHPMHARKMAAALQAATGSDPAERPVLLWVDREAGHGQGKPLHLRARDATDQWAFLAWQLGLSPVDE